MTVKRFIKILKKCEYKDATVLVDGYEYGVCDLGEDGIQLVKYSRDVNSSPDAGEHEIHENGSFVGLVLSRGW